MLSFEDRLKRAGEEAVVEGEDTNPVTEETSPVVGDHAEPQESSKTALSEDTIKNILHLNNLFNSYSDDMKIAVARYLHVDSSLDNAKMILKALSVDEADRFYITKLVDLTEEDVADLAFDIAELSDEETKQLANVVSSVIPFALGENGKRELVKKISGLTEEEVQKIKTIGNIFLELKTS